MCTILGWSPPNPEFGLDCPWLCSDAGEEKARNACHGFDGIEWFEGDNFTIMTTFFGGEGYNESLTRVNIHHPDCSHEHRRSTMTSSEPESSRKNVWDRAIVVHCLMVLAWLS